MNEIQRRLFFEYESLPETHQAVLELLSVVYRPLARSRALEFVNEAGIADPPRARVHPNRWKTIVLQLKRKDLLVERERRIRCNPAIADVLTRSAERKGSLLRWAEAVDQALYRHLYHSRGEYPYYYYDPEELLEDLRLTAHLNQPEQFSQRLDCLSRYFSGRLSLYEVLQRLFNNPFDAKWLASRSPSIRDIAINHVVANAHSTLAPADEPVSVLEEADAGESVSARGRPLIIKHYLLKGDLKAAQQWLDLDESADSALFSGWARCIQGEYGLAVEQFETAIRQIRADTRKRDIVLEPGAGAFFVIAQLGTGDGKRVRQAQKYLDLVLRKDSDNWAVYEALECATDVADGQLKARAAGGLLYGLGLQPALHQLLICTALCWVDKATAREALPDISALRQAAESGGYAWIAAELAQLEARLRSNQEQAESSRRAHERLGTVPLLEAIREEQPWQRGLRALEQMTDKVGAAPAARATKSRLTWRVLADGTAISVEAFEQKLSKSGRWSKGKAVTLKRLHSRANLAFMTLQDERVCQSIAADPVGKGSRSTYSLNAGMALELLVGHPLVFRADSPSTRVDVIRAEPELLVTTAGKKVRIKLAPNPPMQGSVLATPESPTRLVVTSFGHSHREIYGVTGAKGLVVPADSRDQVVRALSSVSALVTVHSDIDGMSAEAEDVEADSTPHFNLIPYEDGLRAEPLVRPFVAEGPSYPPGRGGEVVFATVGGRRSRARRNRTEETRRYREAVASCRTLQGADWDGSGWTLPDPNECLELLDELHALGDRVGVAWPKGETMRIRHRGNSKGLSLKIRKKRGWFDIDGELELDSGLVIGLRELLDGIEETQGRFLSIGEKGFVALTDRFLRRAEELAAFVDRNEKGLRFHEARAPALEALIEEAGTVDSDKSWNDRIRRFREAQALEPVVPSTLQAELRDYQKNGFQWAARLADWGAGACLADDMGLGKTVQALTVALSRAPAGPTLVVAPTSVCPNWIDEARRFTPTLNPAQFGHGDRDMTLKAAGPFDLIVCSYGLLHQEVEGLAAVKWETIVLDEAQAIKNRETMRSRAAMRLDGSFRMITTGTPIENHLGELWNLFNFINPGLLGSSKSFNTKFASAIYNRSGDDATRRLKRLIQPFILRRTKTAVLDELPARTEITVRIEMADSERAFYEALRQRAVETLSGIGSEDGKSHLRILAEIMKLRRACCDPRLIASEVNIPGSKLEAFSATVSDLLDNGHKALVFSQFVDHLRIVRNRLDQKGVSYRYLDGSTSARDRKKEIDAFQSGDGDLFLISLRAGGQGLNLTAADYVLHLDPWWNPAVEDQASDRAHRIGQTRPVTIYRLVMKDTIEEQIVDLHAAKRDLADSLLEGADMSGKMSADELLALVRQG